VCSSDLDFHQNLHNEFQERGEKLVAKLCDLQATVSAFSNETVTGKDFRDTINWFDYALSYPIRSNARDKVIAVVESLGYPSLAYVLRGDVSMSEAKLELEGNSNDGYKVCMYGKANKIGWRAMRTKFGMRVKTPRYRGDKTPYSVALPDAEDFIELALRYWPFISVENVTEIREKINNLPANVVPANPVSSVPKATFYTSNVFPRTGVNLGFEVRMPWINGVTPLLVADFKNQIDKHNRFYKSESRTWHFRHKEKSKVIEILSRHGVEAQ
jgi:hypothetical protein